MSTTNIDKQKMEQIFLSDTITQFMEKCNNNFSNIFQYRSGPEGKQGVEGSQGVPTKPKVPIHVWIESVEYYNETPTPLGDGYVINLKEDLDLTDIKYQEGHLIMLKNGHVYILKEDENSTLKTLKPNYIMALQSYNQDDVVDGRSAYIHIAYAISTNPSYVGFITNEELQESQNQGNVGDGERNYKYMGIYSNYEEKPEENPQVYTWIRIVGDTGEKGDKGDKGDTPSSTSVEVVGYSLEDLILDSEFWKSSISELGELKPGTPIYILNKYTWDDGTTTYGKTVTMAGTQGIKGETGRVLFYLGSFKDGTLKGKTVKGRLNQYRCDYYIDATGQAWMRTGTSEIADGHMFGKDNIEDNWAPSDKVGFLQVGAIHADMINTDSITANSALVTTLFAQDVTAEKLKVNAANIQGTLTANKIKSGKISSTNEKSYFNLDDGEFVLGDANGAALEYKGGTLTIGGVNDDSADSILNRLGIAESSISDTAEALEDALKAIADEEKARTQAIANIESIQESLQEQIDGEVTSWFLEGEPKNDNEPAKDWKTDELKQRHEGDTYTDITTFVSNETTPTAGKSWRWCNTDDEYGTGWHWHKIADNDATKALAEAAKAVAAADGKSKIFVVKPTNYQVGDLWILQSDTDHTAGKKGDILTANAASATYDKTHWSKEVKYTDDSAIDNLEIGGRNILSNTETMEAWTPGGYGTTDSTRSTITKENINDFYGKNATQITSNGGDKKYKVIYDLLYSDNVDLNRQYTLSFNVKAIEHNLCIGCKLSKEKGNDIFFSNKIDIEAGVSKRVTFTGYPFGNDQNLQLWFGAADCDANGDTESKYVANFYINELKLEYGNKATDWTPSTDEMDAKSLTYLKNALAYDTNIAGGIIATSTIQLRDKVINDEGLDEYRVNAGLSGVQEDNILLWGGGDYTEAFNAAASPTYDKGDGTPITTLFKKDGTGKIGIFKISDTQAVVDVQDKGKILIDAAEGIVSIFDKEGNEKVEITSNDIDKDSADIKQFSNPIEFSDYTSIRHKDDTNNGSLVLQSFSLKDNQTYVLEQDNSLTHLYLSYFIGYNNNSLTNINVKFKVIIKSNSSQKHTLCNVDHTFPSETYSTHKTGTLKIQISKIAGGVRAPKLFDNLEIGIYDAMATGDVAGYGTSLPLFFSIKKIWFGSASAIDISENPIEGELHNIRARIKMSEKTIIGNNGFQVQNENGFVQILNDSDKTYIRATNLPTENDGSLDNGQIYNYNGFLRIAGDESTTIDFTEIGYKKVVLPSSVIIPNLPKKDDSHEQDELWIHGDGDVFIEN